MVQQTKPFLSLTMVTTKRISSYARTAPQGGMFSAGTMVSKRPVNYVRTAPKGGMFLADRHVQVYARTVEFNSVFLTESVGHLFIDRWSYEICLNCGRRNFIGHYGIIFPSFSCINCNHELYSSHQEDNRTSPLSEDEISFRAQSEDLIAKLDLDSIIQKCTREENPTFSVLTEEARVDIQNRMRSVLPWIYLEEKEPRSFISNYIQIPKNIDVYMNLLEDVLILITGLLTAKSAIKRYICVITFCKLRGMKPSFSTAILYMLGDFVTSSVATVQKEKKKIR